MRRVRRSRKSWSGRESEGKDSAHERSKGGTGIKGGQEKNAKWPPQPSKILLGKIGERNRKYQNAKKNRGIQL